MIPTDDPVHDWDVYCAEQEEAYAALIDGKECCDCANFREVPDGMSLFGWCVHFGDYVESGDSVEELGCEGFE